MILSYLTDYLSPELEEPYYIILGCAPCPTQGLHWQLYIYKVSMQWKFKLKSCTFTALTLRWGSS